jgi:effector-binding domain-containing protein
MKTSSHSMDRRLFLKAGLGGGLACVSSTALWSSGAAAPGTEAAGAPIKAVIRDELLFAGIRRPIRTRAELEPRIEAIERACAGRITGPLTHIFRFDTPVDGYDSEIGFPVSKEVHSGEVRTHRLRRMHFFSVLHRGSPETLRVSRARLSEHMNRRGLSPELESVEVYHRRDTAQPSQNETEVMASYLAWPEVYKEQLVRVLGDKTAAEIWEGGAVITPQTLVDERGAWVATSIARLRARTDEDQQFDILSRVALVRPPEDVARYKPLYDQEKNLQAVFAAQEEQLRKTPTGGFVDPPRFDGKVLHRSKVPYDAQRYRQAQTHEEKRRAYCFCALIREASDPRIDPIFCYRAAGWDRQFYEPLLGVQFKKCHITHSVLKGDDFCAWDYVL